MSIKERFNKLEKRRCELTQNIRQVVLEINMLQDECNHDDMDDDGCCPDCGFQTKGWFCKSSPTKECEYYDEKTDVYDEDCCIYCGDPEERK